jgi:hypothetical protein
MSDGRPGKIASNSGRRSDWDAILCGGIVAIVVVLAAALPAAAAEPYPSHRITLIVPFRPAVRPTA